MDADLTDTSQFNTAPFGAATQTAAGVNFYYTAGATHQVGAGTLLGIGFDDINLAAIGAAGIAGPTPLTANAPGVTLDLHLGCPVDYPGARYQVTSITGTDAAVANVVARDIRYASASHTNHYPNIVTFGGLGPNRPVYVQMVGGSNGWGGQPDIVANGTTAGTWTTNPAPPTGGASLAGFYAMSDSQGNLEIDTQVNTGNYAGITGLIVHSAPIQDIKLTDASQVLVAPYGEGTTNLAAVNLHYATGTTHQVGARTFQGIGFDDINLTGVNGIVGPVTLTANPPGVTFTGNFGIGNKDEPRYQTANITGTDAEVLNVVARDIRYQSKSATDHRPNIQTFSGLEPYRAVYVQMIGGQGGWTGEPDIYVNSNPSPVGRWTSNPGPATDSASLAGFSAAADVNGDLTIDLQVNQGDYSGLCGTIVQGGPYITDAQNVALGKAAASPQASYANAGPDRAVDGNLLGHQGGGLGEWLPSGSTHPAHAVFDLGTVTGITAISLLNSNNFDPPYLTTSLRATDEFRIFAGNTVNAGGTDLTGYVTELAYGHLQAKYLGFQDVPIDPISARYVKVELLSLYPGAYGLGLAEIRIAIPEPASALLLLGGLAALLRRRRRRA